MGRRGGSLKVRQKCVPLFTGDEEEKKKEKKMRQAATATATLPLHTSLVPVPSPPTTPRERTPPCAMHLPLGILSDWQKMGKGRRGREILSGEPRAPPCAELKHPTFTWILMLRPACQTPVADTGVAADRDTPTSAQYRRRKPPRLGKGYPLPAVPANEKPDDRGSHTGVA